MVADHSGGRDQGAVMKRFEKKVAVVTAGGGLLGRATCVKLGSEGATLVVADRDAAAAERVAEQIEMAGGQALAVTADVATAEGVRALMSHAMARFGRIDVLANIAGTQSKRWIDEITREHWDHVLHGNLTATFLCIQEVVPYMRAGGGGKVVNMASFAIHGVPWFRQARQGRSAYAAAKAGIVGLTRTLAGELADDNINVNVVLPGPVREPGDVEAINALETHPAVKTPPLALIPKRRYATPEDVANAIAFFASDEADYITGESLSIAGGL
jgi:NAD(P)-dependent dehydrogenase (short-subunit alcohol dehydrogenase family)